MHKVGLISCVKKKQKGPLKAKELYNSPIFRKARSYAEKYYDKWYILSAEYNLLDPEKIIKKYNVTLNNKSKKFKIKWAEDTFRQIIKKIKPNRCIIFIHAGKNYYEFLLPLLKKYNYKFKLPLEGLNLFKWQPWYDKHLN